MLEMFYFNSIVLPLLANKIKESSFTKGVMDLFNDATTVAIIVCVLAGILSWIVTSIKLQSAEEQEVLTVKKKLRNIIIACICGVSGSVIIKLFLSYFGYKG